MKAARSRLTLCIRNCPSAIPHLIQCMESLGYTNERIAKPEDVKQSFQTMAVSERREKRKAESQLLPAKSEDDQADPVPTKYWKISNLSRNCLRDAVLYAIEPATLSAANLLATLDRLGLQASRQEMLRLWCFATGLAEDMALTGNLRWFSEVRSLATERAATRGRRCLALTLPVDWEADGLVTIEGLDDNNPEVMVFCHRFTHEKLRIMRSSLPPHRTPEQLYIASNWSEQRVAVATRLEGHPNSLYLLHNEFSSHLVAETDIKVTPLKKMKFQSDLESPGNNIKGSCSAVADNDNALGVQDAKFLENDFTTPKKDEHFAKEELNTEEGAGGASNACGGGEG